jgi:hypothetical protein
MQQQQLQTVTVEVPNGKTKKFYGELFVGQMDDKNQPLVTVQMSEEDDSGTFEFATFDTSNPENGFDVRFLDFATSGTAKFIFYISPLSQKAGWSFPEQDSGPKPVEFKQGGKVVQTSNLEGDDAKIDIELNIGDDEDQDLSANGKTTPKYGRVQVVLKDPNPKQPMSNLNVEAFFQFNLLREGTVYSSDPRGRGSRRP